MSWSDKCSNCGNHRADCNCGDWNGYAKKKKLNNKVDELWKKYVKTNITETRDNVAISPNDMKSDNDTFKKAKIANSQQLLAKRTNDGKNYKKQSLSFENCALLARALPLSDAIKKIKSELTGQPNTVEIDGELAVILIKNQRRQNHEQSRNI